MRSSGPWRVRSVALRRSAPVAAAVLVSAALFCLRPLGLASAVMNSPVTDPLLCVPFLIAYVLGYEDGVTAGLASVALLIAALQVSNGSFSPVGEMITIGPWVAGRIVRSRHRLTDQLRVRNDELLAQQEAYAAEAVRYERSRIAADLHDIVGHALSLMVIQASAGQRVALARGGNARDGGSGEASARTALETVAEAAMQAQAEVGLLAGLLSGDRLPRDQAPDHQGALQAGSPPETCTGLDLAAELVRHAQAAGLEVTYRLVSDGDDDVDPTSAEVVSRIITESLTNALKHAPGAAVTVEVGTAGGALTVTVENGAARHTLIDLPLPGGGYGLTGMRDRVLARGGHFDAGPAGDDGWRVHAVLPASRHLYP
jgi:signal transduction histidine kinase